METWGRGMPSLRFYDRAAEILERLAADAGADDMIKPGNPLHE